MPPVDKLKPLLCVVRKGLTPILRVRTPQEISFAQGADVEIPLDFMYEDDSPVDITAAPVVFTVRNKITTAVLISRIATITDGPNGQAKIELSQTDTITALAAAGVYVYDVQYEEVGTGLRTQPVPLSRLVLLPSSGLPGAPTDTLTPSPLTVYGLPDKINNKYLHVDGVGNFEWIDAGGLPDQTGNAGKFLTTDGTDPAWSTITQDQILAGFSASMSAGFTTIKELGDSIVNPSFTASYNRPATTANLNETDTPGAITLLTPFTAFAYNTAPLPARSYSKSAINATVVWTLTANEGGPNKTSTVTAQWQARRFFGLAATPGSYNEAFIESLASSALAANFSGSYAFGSGGGTQRIYLAWPTAFGNPASIKDQNGFTFPMTKVATAVAVTNAFSVLVPGGYDIWESGFTVAPFTLTVS